jgi:O-antigen/teichoic acid export membrane protein
MSRRGAVTQARAWTTNAALAFAGDIAAKSSSLVVVAVASHVLSVPEFAALATAMAYAYLLVPLLDGGAQMLISRDGSSAPERRGGLFVAAMLGRAPVAVLGVSGALAIGLATGHLGLWLGTALLVLANAASLSLGGVLRASQDFLPETAFKLLYATLTAAAASIASVAWSSADAVLVALAIGALLAQWPMWTAVTRRATFHRRASVRSVVRAALPLGLLTMIAAAYGRSGTIALSQLSTHAETARFAIASTLAFGLLSAAQAVVGALLPRLASEADELRRLEIMRRTVRTLAAGSVVVGGAMALLGPIAIEIIFGDRYHAASTSFAILCGALPLIVVNSVLGTCLLATGHVRPVVLQTVVTLVVNVAVLVALVPGTGADGAALATVACELAGVAVLLIAIRRRLPGLTLIGRPRTPWASPRVAA